MVSEEMRQCVEFVTSTVTRTYNIKDYKIGEIDVNQKGKGFLSEIFMFTIIDQSNEKKLNLLVKHILREEAARKAVKLEIFFENEVYFYTNIYPSLQNFRESVGCPKQYELLARCHQTSLNQGIEFLVLDNLKPEGFSTVDNEFDLTINHMELLFKNYGYFHGLSFALKEKQPKMFADLIAQIQPANTTLFQGNHFQEILKFFANEMNKVLVPGRDDSIIEKLKPYLTNIVGLLLESVKSTGKYTVLIHGDAWSNNTLFKYDATGKPIDLRLIDWQIITLANPVCDLSYALYSDASKEIIDNYEDFLEIYYESLTSTIRKCGCDSRKIFTFEGLKHEWRIYAKYGFILGSIIIRTKCTKQEDLKSIDGYEQESEDVKVYQNERYNVTRYQKKVYDLLEHMCYIGAL